MTDEEKTEGSPPEESSEASDGIAERENQDVPEGGEGPADAEEAEEATDTETPPPAGSDHDSELHESVEISVESAQPLEPPARAGSLPEAPEPRSEEKKGDVIPGADLEPIAVEPEVAPLSAEEQARLEAEEEERARREAELIGETEEEEPGMTNRAPAQMESGARYLATGKRKNAIARVTLTPGEGRFEVNNRALEEFFPRPLHQTMARQPLVAAGYEGSVDVRVLVHGGGISGQAGALRHGIARALTEIDPELRGDLKRRGFLTRDARVKERRKAGLKKARKRPQFSKR